MPCVDRPLVVGSSATHMYKHIHDSRKQGTYLDEVVELLLVAALGGRQLERPEEVVGLCCGVDGKIDE